MIGLAGVPAAAGAAVDPEQVTPGLLGFFVVLAIGLATWALMRSMTKRLKNISVPRDGDGRRADGGRSGGAPADGSGEDGQRPQA